MRTLELATNQEALIFEKSIIQTIIADKHFTDGYYGLKSIRFSFENEKNMIIQTIDIHEGWVGNVFISKTSLNDINWRGYEQIKKMVSDAINVSLAIIKNNKDFEFIFADFVNTHDDSKKMHVTTIRKGYLKNNK
jgi:hypothetical protein